MRPQLEQTRSHSGRRSLKLEHEGRSLTIDSRPEENSADSGEIATEIPHVEISRVVELRQIGVPPNCPPPPSVVTISFPLAITVSTGRPS